MSMRSTGGTYLHLISAMPVPSAASRAARLCASTGPTGRTRKALRRDSGRSRRRIGLITRFLPGSSLALGSSMRTLRTHVSAAILGMVASASGAALGYPLHQVVPPGGLPLGVDIHSGVGDIDWSAVKSSGRTFAIIKATQGDYGVDTRFADNWSGAQAQGILRSAYHFYDPTSDPDSQAALFLSTVGDFDAVGVLPPMLDIECPTSSNPDLAYPHCEGHDFPGWVPSAELNAGILHWLDVVESQTGRRPFVYSYNAWFFDTGVDLDALSAYPLDISYPADDSFYVPNDWLTALVWQDSVCNTVPGIPGADGCTDTDRFVGTLAELEGLAAGKPTPSQVTGNDAMTLVSWSSDGHPEIFLKKRNGEMVHTYPNALTDQWNSFYDLDGGSSCGMAAAFWPQQRYAELFDAAVDGTSQHLFFDAISGWTNWLHDMVSPATALSHMSTLVWPDGQVEVFALGGDGSLFHTHLAQGGGAGGGSPWESLGGSFVTGGGPIVWGDGHAEVFATDASGRVFHSWSGSGPDFPGGWHDWAGIAGSIASRPMPVRWLDGHVEVFATGTDGRLYHSDFSSAGWPAFELVDSATILRGEPSPVMNPEGHGAEPGAEVFARDRDGRVVHLWQSNGAYTAFSGLLDQESASDPFGFTRADGQVEVFAIDSRGQLTRTLHGRDGGWTAWATIGGDDLDPCSDSLPGSLTGSSANGASGGSSGNGDGGAASGAKAAEGCSCRSADASAGGAFEGVCLIVSGLASARFRRRARR